MKLMSLIGATLAAALLFSFPAAAAVVSFDHVAPMTAPTQHDDCVVSLAVDNAILFVEATQNCDATMAELTGLCLTPLSEPMPPRIAAVLAPNEGITCAAIRPSPPG